MKKFLTTAPVVAAVLVTFTAGLHDQRFFRLFPDLIIR